MIFTSSIRSARLRSRTRRKQLIRIGSGKLAIGIQLISHAFIRRVAVDALLIVLFSSSSSLLLRARSACHLSKIEEQRNAFLFLPVFRSSDGVDARTQNQNQIEIQSSPSETQVVSGERSVTLGVDVERQFLGKSSAKEKHARRSSCLQIHELENVNIPVMLLPEHFKAFTKIRIDNQNFNK